MPNYWVSKPAGVTAYYALVLFLFALALLLPLFVRSPDLGASALTTLGFALLIVHHAVNTRWLEGVVCVLIVACVAGYMTYMTYKAGQERKKGRSCPRQVD